MVYYKGDFFPMILPRVNVQGIHLLDMMGHGKCVFVQVFPNFMDGHDGVVRVPSSKLPTAVGKYVFAN